MQKDPMVHTALYSHARCHSYNGWCKLRTAYLLIVLLQALAAKDEHISELQQRLSNMANSTDDSANQYEANVTKMILSLTQMNETCTAQVHYTAMHFRRKATVHLA